MKEDFFKKYKNLVTKMSKNGGEYISMSKNMNLNTNPNMSS